jgi:hypothetical protein
MTTKKFISLFSKEFRPVAMALLLITTLCNYSYAVTYYSRTNGGNWNTNTTWSTVAYGNATNTGTFPQAGDVVNIGNGYTIWINVNAACATLNVGQGASGVLEFRSTSNFVLTVSGNITVNTGANFRYNTATNRTHVVNHGGNLTNFGTIDFYRAANQVVNYTSNLNTNSIVSGTGTFDLNTVTLNKGINTATLNVQAINFENGIKTIVLTRGTYSHNNTGTFSANPSANFTIGPNVVVRVPRGTIRFANTNNGLTLQGQLYVSGGNVTVGSAAGVMGILSDQNGTTIPYLEISTGSLTVYGGISFQSATEPFSYRQTGGTVLLNTGTTGTNRQVFCVNDVANSVFFMSGGTITLQKPNIAGTNTYDVGICGTLGTNTVTAGSIIFGNTSTPANAQFNFRPFANATYPHFRLSGPAASAVFLRTSANSTANFRLLSLTIDAGKTFDIRSITGTPGDNKQMTLLNRANATEAIVNNGTFTARTSTVTFNTTGAQAIGGTTTTTFYNLSINNASHITLNRPCNVSNYLSMTNGKLITTNTNLLTCQASASASLGSATSFVDGPMVHTVATSANVTKVFPIGKGTAHRPVELSLKHTNATSTTYRAEVFNAPASALPYSKPASIANVSGTRYVRFIRQNVANFTNGRIRMYYGTDDLVLDYNSLLVAHNNTTQWQNFGGVATGNGTGNILSNTFTNFNSYFALGNPPGGGNPLPVTITSFSGKIYNGIAYINWQTQSEINNEKFILQRSADNINFEDIHQVAGAGNSTTTLNYGYDDIQPLSGISYYRLKQIDFDGTITYYGPAMISNLKTITITPFPNPAYSTDLQLRSNLDLTTAKVTCISMDGRQIEIDIEKSNIDSQYKVLFRQSKVHTGFYIIKLQLADEVIAHKIYIL